ncbi:MAG TPA: THUMP domain-containing protein [Acidimicrobiales bacterium]
MDCLVVCAPGLEAVLTGELADLRLRPRRTVRGGVEVRATTRQLYAANVWLRSASRVLVRAGRFRAQTFDALERRLGCIDWSPWISEAVRVRVRASCSGSRLHHSGAVAERVGRVVRGTNDADAPEQLVVVRVHRDVVTVSVDASGEHLHRRGWRLATGKAPLRETLAAAMVLASGWRGETPLVDPLCGSGTIAIEAALLAQGRAPGAGRPFAFQRWPSFEPGTWASVREDVRRADAEASRRFIPPIVAADRDAGAVAAARANAERAGVSAVVEMWRQPIAATLAALPSPPGWVITNPPYGARVGGTDLRDLYATLGRVVRAPVPWNLGVLVADRVLAGQIGTRLEDRFRTTNGGIPVTFCTTPAAGLPGN